MGQTKIPWAKRTWNPITGCTKISEGCKNCYAERMSKRLAGRYGYPADEPFKVTLHEDRINDPFHWKKDSQVFVCSMGDLFHKDVPDEWISEVLFPVHALTCHQWMILTKRPGRMLEYFQSHKIPESVWLGVTAENQKAADWRIPFLLQIPSAIRFVSIEPMLEPIEIEPGSLARLDWVICGCESGPGKRPIERDAIRDLRDQCVAANVPFFLKQMVTGGKVTEMPKLDGKVWDQKPIMEVER